MGTVIIICAAPNSRLTLYSSIHPARRKSRKSGQQPKSIILYRKVLDFPHPHGAGLELRLA